MGIEATHTIHKNKQVELVTLAISIVILNSIPSFEIQFAFITLLFTALFLVNQGRIYKNTFLLMSTLLLIVLTGVISMLFEEHRPFDTLKDTLYFIKPVFMIGSGYFLSRKIENPKSVVKILVLLGVFFAMYHLVHILIFTDFNHFSISRIRAVNGLDNMIEVVAMVLIIMSFYHEKINIISSKTTKMFFLIVLFVSFSLYFSRSMMIGLLLMLLGGLGYAKLNTKGVKYLTFFLVIIASLYIYLFTANITRESKGVKNFLYKIKMAPSEIFTPKFDLNNHAALWDHWRAYEASCAFDQLNDKKTRYIIGKGFGGLVDLKFLSPLGEHGMQYIPILHNGYAYVLFKTGLVGFFLYLIFLLYLYFQSYDNQCKETLIYKNIVSGFGLYFLFSSLIITGIYNDSEILTFIMGMFLFFIHKKSIDA